MKAISLVLVILFTGLACKAQSDKQKLPDPAKKLILAEASCGQCQFKLTGKGCDLAVRIDGKAYYVDGTNIDDHGDAHAKDGFCNAIRKAEVQGEVVNDRFVATYFKLVKAEEKNPPKKDD